MNFNSSDFLIFFPIVTILYFIIPLRVKRYWLLIASYYFYMSWNPKYAVLIFTSTLVTWCGALLIDKMQNHKRILLFLSIAVNLFILFFFKYFGFITNNLVTLFLNIGITINAPEFDVILPVGISFYTFQALGYTIDVYRGDTKVEKNFFIYALFVSFFPQLVAGPIERSKNLLSQMHEKHYFDSDRVVRGLILMGFGFFKKIVIADRIAVLVTSVYDGYTTHTGIHIIMATILFAFQIYCDFSGYSDIAIGAAKVMGFNLMKNFDTPYFSKSVAEFWRRWHISLSTWFRDYVYIPLGGNRKGVLMKYRNLLMTFCLSGLWHGASWNFVMWGGLNGLFQVIGDITKEARRKTIELFKFKTDCWSWRFLQCIITFVLIDFAWLFFRANGARHAISLIKHTINNMGFSQIFNIGSFFGREMLGLDYKDIIVMCLGLLLLLIIDVAKDKLDITSWIFNQNLWFRFLVYYIGIFIILIFGYYGPEFDSSSFMYFQF